MSKTGYESPFLDVCVYITNSFALGAIEQMFDDLRGCHVFSNSYEERLFESIQFQRCFRESSNESFYLLMRLFMVAVVCIFKRKD